MWPRDLQHRGEPAHHGAALIHPDGCRPLQDRAPVQEALIQC